MLCNSNYDMYSNQLINEFIYSITSLICEYISEECRSKKSLKSI
jgi:hypothetical protein